MHDLHMIMNKIIKSEEGEVGMLRLLWDGVGDSSRRVLSAWRHPLAFFTFFFSLEAQRWF